jgi:SAM-dependent methyltransferase
MNWTEEKQKISNYYERLIEIYGYRHEACDYGRAESQTIKFSVLSDVLDHNNKSILDVGCGFADYYDYLKNKYTNFCYTGVDITKAFVLFAKEKYPEVDIRHFDILNDAQCQKYDIVTANGIFYLLSNNPEQIMLNIIQRMYDLCIHAVSFNSLSSWCLDQQDGEYYADPLDVFRYCKSLTPWVTLRHDYHSRDFSVYLYKNKNS